MTHASTTSFPRHPRLRSFARRFGRAHLDFACHAAFPLALTPDLLYLLWAAFPRDARDQPIGAPWVAVADLLLSSLCDEVGHELFEFEPEVRDELLAELKRSPRFGPARITALAAFVSEYVGQQLRSSDPFVRDFAEAQHWAARAATDPAGAAAELARAYAELRGTERDRLLRLEAIIEAIARPERASDIESLLPYARALADWARGDQARAAVVLRSMANSTGQIRLGGLVLPVPPAIAAPAVVPPANSERRTQSSERGSQPTHSPPDTGRLLNDDEREQLEQTLLAHRRRLQLLEEQYPQRSRSARPEIIDEIAGLRAQIASMERQQLENLRALYRSRLQSAEQQQAQLGMNTPPHTVLYIEELRGQVADIELQLDQRQRDDEAQVLAAGPAHNEALEQLREQHDTTQRTLHLLEQQRAYFGPAAPLNVLSGIQEARAQLAQLDAQIRELSGNIDATAVDPAEEIAYLQALRAIQVRRLRILQEQRAMLGSMVPTEIAIEISELTQELEATEQQLREYGAPLEAPSSPDEGPAPGTAEERAQLEELRDAHLRRLQILQEQQVRYDIHTPPHIIMEIEDARAAIARIDKQLSFDQSNARIAQQDSSADARMEELLANISSEMSQLNAAEVPAFLLAKAFEMILSDTGTVHGYDPHTRELVLLAERGVGSQMPHRQSLNEGITGLAAKERQSIRLDNVMQSEEYIRVVPTTTSELAVPLLDGDELRGVINLESASEAQYSEADARFVQALAALAARALRTTEPAEIQQSAVPEGTPTRPQLEQQRADIQRRLQKLEQRSHRTPEPTPQSATETAELRRQLSEIEEQLAELIIAETLNEDEFEAPTQTADEAFEIVIIHIARQGSGYSISLVGDAGIAQAALVPSEAQLEELAGLARRRLDEVVNTQVGGQFVYQSERTSIEPEVYAQSLRTLAEAGSFLYHQLFFGPGSGEDSHALGNQLRELSQRARLRITIISERVFLPWALLYDGPPSPSEAVNPENFWGFRHVIECQLPSTSANLPAIASGALITPDSTLELAFVGDNGLDNQLAQPVVEQQRASLSALPNVRLQDYSNVSDLYRLLSDSSMATDVIYIYALMLGNSDADADDTRICLGDEQIMLTELRARLSIEPLTGRPFVFMNAQRLLSADPTQTDSFVPYFLQRGARAVLGGEASLPVFFAAQFGMEFVSRFVAGEESAGNLLLALRRAYLTQRRNVLGLLYALYGHADARVKRSAPGPSNVAFDEEEFDPESFDFQDFGSEADNHPPIF